MKLGTWLLSLLSPAIARIFTSLGFSLVTITGFDVAIQALRTQLIGSVNSLPADMLNVFLLGGGGIALGIVLGAVATRVLIWQINNAVKILGKTPG